MRYREFLPAPCLRDRVLYYWYFEKDGDESLFAKDHFGPDPFPYLIFQMQGYYSVEIETNRVLTFGNVVACSGQRKVRLVDLPGKAVSLGVRFRTAGAANLGLFDASDVNEFADYDELWALELLDSFRFQENPCSPQALAQELEAKLLRLTVQRKTDLSWQHAERLVRREGQACPLAELQRIFSCSPRQLERRFRQVSGYSPREYRSISAISSARFCLFSEPDQNQANLAASLGFYDQAHFSKVFRRYTNLSPSDYSDYIRPYRAFYRGDNRLFFYGSETDLALSSKYKKQGNEPLVVVD